MTRLALLATAATSALFAFAPVSQAQDAMWDQFYAGVYADYSAVDSKWTPGNSYVFNVDGFSGGVMLGADRQFNTLVVGLELDAGFGSLNDTAQPDNWKVDMGGVNLAARARAGLALDNVLLYGTAGIAMVPMHVKYDSAPNVVDDNDVGFQGGIGIEYAVSDEWHVRGEYLHTELGKSEPFSVAPAISMDTRFDTFRVAVSHTF